jgi:hypothetical protein
MKFNASSWPSLFPSSRSDAVSVVPLLPRCCSGKTNDSLDDDLGRDGERRHPIFRTPKTMPEVIAHDLLRNKAMNERKKGRMWYNP